MTTGYVRGARSNWSDAGAFPTMAEQDRAERESDMRDMLTVYGDLTDTGWVAYVDAIGTPTDDEMGDYFETMFDPDSDYAITGE